IHARFIHTSTEMGQRELIARHLPAEKIVCIRRGLATFPAFKPLRAKRQPLRLICIARLVQKKGLDYQMRIYAAVKEAGISFEARIVGEGPLRTELIALIGKLGLVNEVKLLGQLPQP